MDGKDGKGKDKDKDVPRLPEPIRKALGSQAVSFSEKPNPELFSLNCKPLDEGIGVSRASAPTQRSRSSVCRRRCLGWQGLERQGFRPI